MLKRIFKIIGLVIVVLTIGVFILFRSLQPSPPPEAQLWFNGNIITMADKQPISEAILISKDKIEAVGLLSELQKIAPAGTIMHDLKGQTMIPGFVDAHSHFPGSGMALFAANLNSPPVGQIKTIDDLLSRLQQQANQTPSDKWIAGFGYDQLMLAENRHPTRAELDVIAPTQPLFIMHVSGHLGVANSAALQQVASELGQPWSEEILSSGIVEENDATPFQRHMFNVGVMDFFNMVSMAQQEYQQAGVTTLQASNVDKQYIQALSFAKVLGMIPQRLVFLPTYETLGQQLISGETNAVDLESKDFHMSAIKLIADGSIQGFTGYLAKPYHTHQGHSEEYRGYPRIEASALKEQVLDVVSHGFQVAVHGNGDASIDDILDAFEYATSKTAKPLHRPIIIHAQMARQDQLQRMAALGVIPSFFVSHTYYWGDAHFNTLIGPERANRISPTQSAKQLGLRFTNHLDTPVVPMSPMLAWWSSVERQTATGRVLGEQEQLSVLDGLRALTLDAAWQINLEDKIGSLEPGKQADFTILEDNPLSSEKAIKDITVLETIVGGLSIFKH